MEVAAGLIKLKPDSKSKVDEWRDTMKSRMEEALATLVHEGTFKHPIDKYHYELMAGITAPDGNIVAKPLLDLKV